MKVVKENLELNTRKYKIFAGTYIYKEKKIVLNEDVVFTIVGTILNYGKPDIVVNMANGKNKKYTRLDLKEMTEQFNAIGL